MGKIEDAIGKVQRERGARARREGSAPQQAAAEAVPARKRRDYGGRKLVLDRRRLIDAGLLDPDYIRKHLTAEYRRLRRAILDRSAGETPRGNLVLLGSAASGDGTSFLCLNLSMCLAAETAQSVVLVDANPRSPALSERSGVLEDPGLAELLADPAADAKALICPTDVPGLAVLPIGRARDGLAGALAGERADTVFDALSAEDPSRLFLFDGEPVQPQATSPALASRLGQAVLVVRAGVTPRRAVREALYLLEGERPVGIVLNRVVPGPVP